MSTLALILFFVSNIVIVLGYAFLGLRVVPKAAARLKRTRIGGILFFTTCGLTHVHLLWHAATPSGYSLEHMLEPFSLLVHLVQAVAVWMFVTGLYVEYVRWGPWRAAHENSGAVHAGRLVGADRPSDLPGVDRDAPPE